MSSNTATISTCLKRPRARLGLAALEVAFIFLAFSIRGGWSIPSGGEAHYLTRAKHYWNHDWCPNDFFCETPDAHWVFDCTFGLVTLVLPLPAVAMFGRLLEWGLLAWSWQRMSRAMVPLPFASILSATLFATLGYTCQLAGEWVVGGIEAKCFSYAFVFLAIEAVGRDRWNRVWLLLGLASAFHVLVGGWTTLAVICAWLMGNPKWPRLRTMAPGLVGGALLALLGLVPALALTWNTDSAVVIEANHISVFERLSHHLWPLSFSNRAIARHLPLITAWCLLIFLVPGEASQLGLRRIVNCSIVFSLFGWAIALGFVNQPDTAASLLQYYWFRMSDSMLPTGVAIVGTSSILQLSRASPRLGAVWGAMLVLVTAFFVSYLMSGKRISYASSDFAIANVEDWHKSCAWIAANTPRTAVFITPCLAQSFHWHTGRAEVVNRKNCPQDAAGIVEWRKRIDDLYRIREAGSVRWADTVNELGIKHVLRVGRFYDADYVVATGNPPLDLPTVGPPGLYYVIYKLPDPFVQ